MESRLSVNKPVRHKIHQMLDIITDHTQSAVSVPLNFVFGVYEKRLALENSPSRIFGFPYFYLAWLKLANQLSSTVHHSDSRAVALSKLLPLARYAVSPLPDATISRSCEHLFTNYFKLSVIRAIVQAITNLLLYFEVIPVDLSIWTNKVVFLGTAVVFSHLLIWFALIELGFFGFRLNLTNLRFRLSNAPSTLFTRRTWRDAIAHLKVNLRIALMRSTSGVTNK